MMIRKTFFYVHFFVLGVCVLGSCNSFLEEKVYSQLAPENYLRTKEGLISLLYDSYAKAANMNWNNGIYVLGPQEWVTDILYQSGDNVEATIRNYINFNWDPNMDFLTGNWDPPYECIRDANILLENIPNAAMTDADKTLFTAEAKFLRAISYYKLHNMFGTVPLRVSSTQELNLARADETTLLKFIEDELKDAMQNLPLPTAVSEKYRAHRAAAMGFLIRFYLNKKNWQQVSDYTKDFLNTFTYSLYPKYEDLFKVEHENNAEYIWVKPAFASSDRATANSWMNCAFPDNFASAPELGITFQSTWLNWPNEFRIYDAFYTSFETNDRRKKLFLTSYVDKSNNTISLLGNDNIRSFKYWPDPNNAGASHGNDIPEIRLAEIYLSRAEALNELSGPTQEALDNINVVRRRADLADLKLVDMLSKENLRNLILLERGHEFYNEGHRRTDLIRMGKFVEQAVSRGKAAKDYHVVFPIPQVVIDSDPLIEQNPNF